MKEEFIQKADENLKAAKILIDGNLYNAASNRAYFAIYHIAIAILKHYNITSEKNEHDWVQSTFNGELIKRRSVFPSRIRSYLLNSQRLRNVADYSEKMISKKAALRQVKKAEDFINLIMEKLNK